jgi:hypothetical protein
MTIVSAHNGQPLSSSCQSSWLQIQRSRVRFTALPDFLRNSGSRTGSTKPREYNWGAAWKKKVAAPVSKAENTAVGIRYADHVAALYSQKLALTSPTSGGRSICLVLSLTKATEFVLFVCPHIMRWQFFNFEDDFVLSKSPLVVLTRILYVDLSAWR